MAVSPTPSEGPVDYDNVLWQSLALGGVFRGFQVAAVYIRTADGRTQKCELPERSAQPSMPAEEEPLRPTARKILDTLRASTVPLTRKAVAARLGRETTNGKFGSEIRELHSRGLIFTNGEEITDDASKFESIS